MNLSFIRRANLTPSIRDSLRDKMESLEKEARQAKEQLAELARTATDYSNMIKAKEDEISRVTADLDKSKAERKGLLNEVTELKNKIETLTSEMRVQQEDRERGSAARTKLQEELDELRILLAAKATEETRRNEAEKSKEFELADLRSQVTKLSQQLTDAQKQALEGQSKLKVELDTLIREHRSLEQAHKSLSERESLTLSQLKKAEAALADAEKHKRALESDLQSVRSRQLGVEDQLAVALKEKEVVLVHLSRRFMRLTSPKGS